MNFSGPAVPDGGDAPNVDQRKLIMLIEDDRLHRKLFVTWLEMGGYRVHCLDDERRAHVEAVQTRPDAIIADIRLPHIDGRDVIRQLKARDDTRHIPIMAITVLTGREEEASCYAVGADTFVSKSTRLAGFLDQLAAVLRPDPPVPR